VVEALVILLLFLEKHALAAMLGWRRMAQVADAVVAGVRLLPPSGLGEISQAAAALRSNFNNTVLKIPRYVEDEEDEDDHSIAEGAPNHTAAALRVPHQHLPTRSPKVPLTGHRARPPDTGLPAGLPQSSRPTWTTPTTRAAVSTIGHHDSPTSGSLFSRIIQILIW
jgi:hypothetical protein